MNAIPTFVINNNRTGRKAHILKEFSGRGEFNLTIVKPLKYTTRSISTWETLKLIIQELADPEDNFIIVCKDTHRFTGHYQKELLSECIRQANDMNADILCGGVSELRYFVKVRRHIFWMGNSSGWQLTVIYRRFFKTIIDSACADNEFPDLKIAKLTENRFLIFPFISVEQPIRSLGAPSFDPNKRLGKPFSRPLNPVKFLTDVSSCYKPLPTPAESLLHSMNYDYFYFPTYIISLPGVPDHSIQIEKQFSEKKEFDVHIAPAVKQAKKNLALWLTIREIIEEAMDYGDDILIICKDDHEFTADYVKNAFIKDVMKAHALGAGILLGGVSHFSGAALLTERMFWIDAHFHLPFMVIYNSLFQEILNAPFDDRVIPAALFSEISANILVTFPFISKEKYGEGTINHPANGHVKQMNFSLQPAAAHFEKMLIAHRSYPYEDQA